MASYRASCRALMTGTFQFESWIDLHSFNTWSWNKVSWSIKHILVLPKYKQSVFCQRISQLHKIMTYVPNKWITYVLTISPFGNPWQNHNKQMRYERSHNHSTHIHLLNTIKSLLTQTLEKLCKKRVYGK